MINDKTSAQIVGPDGAVANKPALILDHNEAQLLRNYKKFLMKHGMREAVYCNDCWEGNRDDGMRAFVTDSQILFECRCRSLFHQGQTF